MLTLYDVLDLCGDESKLHEWLRGYGVLPAKRETCEKCGSSLNDCVRNGKAGMVCSNQGCRARLSAVGGGLLEGSKLSLKQFVLLTYWWAHDSAGIRAEHMLGHGPVTVADWSARFRQCVLNEQAASGEVLGGPDMEVEADENEIGRKKKGIHGHDNRVIGDVRGVWTRLNLV